jgi:hypothetical protein
MVNDRFTARVVAQIEFRYDDIMAPDMGDAAVEAGNRVRRAIDTGLPWGMTAMEIHRVRVDGQEEEVPA